MASRSLGTLTLDLVAKIGGFETGMDRAARLADRRLTQIERRAYAFGQALGGSLRNAAGNLAGFAAGFVSIQAAITGLKTAIDTADKLNDFNVRLGVSAEALSGWGYAAQQSGTDIDALGTGLKKLSKAMAEALDPKSSQAKLFEALGVSVKDAQGNLRSLEEMLPEIASAFKALDNETLEASLAMELFGKSGTDLLEFLNLGSDGLTEMQEKARELGIELSANTLKAADEFNDTSGDLKAATNGLFTQLAAELLPELQALTKNLIEIVKEGRKAGEIADALSGAMRAIGFAASEAGNRLDGFGQIIEGVTTGFVELAGASRAVFGGEFKRAMDIIRGSDSDATIGQGVVRLITGASDKIKAETGALAQDIRAQFDAALKPIAKPDPELEKRLNRVFAGSGDGTKKTKRTGKSEAEKEAEALAKAYESTNEKLKEQIALFGQDGEAAALRYELEHGALSKLDPLKKAELVTLAEKLDLMRDEADVQKELDAQNDAREKSAKAVLESIQAERETLGLSSEQWEIYNNLKRAGVEANTALGQSIIEETKALQAEAKALEPQIAIMDEFRSGLEDTFVDIIQGNKSISDSFEDLFDDLQAQILRWIAKQAFGAQGTTGQGSWGWIGQLGAALFGGGRAAGGQVLPGQIYRVNENGPELLSMGNRDYLMMGSQGGKVTPSNGMSSGVAVTQNFINPQLNDPRSESQRQQQAAQQLRIASLRNA